jgi:uncharacterized protein
MKTTLLAVLAVATAGVALAQTAPASAPAKHKVVFQMNVADNDSWNQLFGNIGNARRAFEKDGIQIEVVFYGKGITALLKTNTAFEERLKKAAADGVVLGACQNTMRIRKITSQDIFPFATEVDSGVAELIRKQEAGFAYIRAGE